MDAKGFFSLFSDATTKDNDHFNSQFMGAFKRTQCFQEWYDVRPDAEFFDALPSGHPFAGTLSVADMKLKLAQWVYRTHLDNHEIGSTPWMIQPSTPLTNI